MAENGDAVSSVNVSVLVMPNVGAPAGLSDSVLAALEEHLRVLGYTTQRFTAGGLGGGGPHLDALLLETLHQVARILPGYLAGMAWKLGGQWREHKRRESLPRATVYLYVKDVELSRSLIRDLPDVVNKLGATYPQIRLAFVYSLELPDHMSHANFEFPLRPRAAREVERRLEAGTKEFFAVAWRPTWWPGAGVDVPSVRPRKKRRETARAIRK